MIVRTNCSTTAISLSFAALITLLALPVSRPVLGQGAGQQSPMGRLTRRNFSCDLALQLSFALLKPL